MTTRAAFASYRVAVLMLAAVLSWLGFVVGAQPNYSDILVAIIGTAGVVITVFGIWIAIIFPRFVSSLGEGVEASKMDDSRRYKVLLVSLYRSALTLSAALVALLLVSFFPFQTKALAALMLFFSALCCISLFESLFSSVANGESAATDAINQGVVLGVVRRRRRKT